MKKMFITIMICLSLFGVISMDTASAEECNSNVVNSYKAAKNGNSKTFVAGSSTFNSAIHCTCKGGDTACTKMKNEMATGKTFSDAMIDHQIGAEYYVFNGTQRDVKYTHGMKNLWHVIKSVLNVFIGVLLFILGFGFVYNITSLGMHSSNPQMRQMCIQKLGDVFATALFVGLIPLVFQFITSLITAIN